MIFILIILIAILFYNIKVTPQGEFHTDYSSPKQTATINAIATLLIFFSHASQYVKLDGFLDEPYLAFRKYIGQLVVASFLFFSGFGMMESIKRKGTPYVKSIPTKRFFKVWYHFAVALILYIIVGLVFNRGYSISQTLLAFTGYRAIGNSNWYMFVTFAMYIIIFLAFMIAKKSNTLGVILVFAFTLGFAFLEYKIGLEQRYYNTIFCFVFGMMFSLIKPYFDKLVMKNDLIYVISTAFIFLAYFIFEHYRGKNVVTHNAFAIFAVVLIMMINMKVKIGNPILDFFGSHIFSFFILQRIPMIILNEIGFSKNKYSFIIVSFVATIVLTLVFDTIMDKTDKLIYKRNK